MPASPLEQAPPGAVGAAGDGLPDDARQVADGARTAATVEALARLALRLPALQAGWLSAGHGARGVGLALATVFDAVTLRLVELAAARLGPAPRPFAWAVAGSHARREQSFHTDQDHVLVLGDGGEPAGDGPWFEALAGSVEDGLAACGVTRCAGETMASNPRWRRPASGWRDAFRRWIDEPSPKSVMLLGLFLDLRVVAGDPALLRPVLREACDRARSSHLLLGHLAAHALTLRPPLGLFRRFRLEAGPSGERTLDLKAGGLMPVVELARVAALSVGAAGPGTVERLRAAAGSPALSGGGARELEAALAVFGLQRARLHCAQAERGHPPDDRLAPAALAPGERSTLRAAFAAVRRQQELLRRHFHAEWSD